MLYTNDNIKHIDFSKYKRFIAIGCSFTRYRWASWADLLASEMPQAEYTNVGKPGAGNMYIMVALQKLKRKLNLGPDDLVGIMWSTYCREDRKVKGDWKTPGNIFTQDTYNQQFVEEFVDFDWYCERDTALISTVMQTLHSESFDSFALSGVGLEEQLYYAGLDPESANTDLFDELAQARFPVLSPSVLTSAGGTWDIHYSYINSPHKEWGGDGSQFDDYHPSSPVYRKFLQQAGFSLTEYSETLSTLSDEMMQQVQGDDVFYDTGWPWNEHYDGDLV